MVQIVKDYIPGSTEIPPFEFRVYPSYRDKKRVLGYLAGRCVIHGDGGNATWITMQFGMPVRDAFQQTLDLARAYGMETVWVNDPEGLFPDANQIIASTN